MSLLGESAVDITPSTDGHADSGVRLRAAGHAPAQLADVAEQASAGHRRRSPGCVTDIRAGKGTVGKLMTDEQLYTELQQFVDDGRTR